MTKWGVIDNDEVVNVIIWNGIDPIPVDWNLLPNEDGRLAIGMKLIAGEWQFQKKESDNDGD